VAFLSTFAAQVFEGGAAGTFRFLGESTQDTAQNTFEHFEEETGEAFQQFNLENDEASNLRKLVAGKCKIQWINVCQPTMANWIVEEPA